MTDWYRVTRDVPADDPHNWYGAAVAKGSIFPETGKPTYGSCDLEHGIALESLAGEYFEFPRDAVVRVSDLEAIASGHGIHLSAADVDPCGNGPINTGEDVPF